MKWYERYPAIVDRERSRIRQAFPDLFLDTTTGGEAIVTGVITVASDLGYTTHLVVPHDYPRREPSLKCNPKEIPWKADRHVNSNGTACLCVASEYRIHWPRGSDLADFLSNLVEPYFLSQLYYDAHGRWPPTGQRSHGREGILEAYREFLEPIGPVREQVLYDTMKLMARVSDPKRHEPCPCGSGRKLRKCHWDIFSKLRRQIDRRHARDDFEFVQSYDQLAERREIVADAIHIQ